MIALTPETVRRVVREVLAELRATLEAATPAASSAVRVGKPVSHRPTQGPRILTIFQAGVRNLTLAREQVRLIDQAAARSAVYTIPSARSLVCGPPAKGKEGPVQCVLDTVGPEGLEKVLAKSDLLLLPTFCLRNAAKVARLLADDLESNLILAALVQGKKILATRDGFMLCPATNPGLQREIAGILDKLAGFGMTLRPTAELWPAFRELFPGNNESLAGPDLAPPRLWAFISAQDVQAEAKKKTTTMRLARSGKITHLALDLAKELSIEILRENDG